VEEPEGRARELDAERVGRPEATNSGNHCLSFVSTGVRKMERKTGGVLDFDGCWYKVSQSSQMLLSALCIVLNSGISWTSFSLHILSLNTFVLCYRIPEVQAGLYLFTI